MLNMCIAYHIVDDIISVVMIVITAVFVQRLVS